LTSTTERREAIVHITSRSRAKNGVNDNRQMGENLQESAIRRLPGPSVRWANTRESIGNDGKENQIKKKNERITTVDHRFSDHPLLMMTCHPDILSHLRAHLAGCEFRSKVVLDCVLLVSE
jgi:hypothetical protein